MCRGGSQTWGRVLGTGEGGRVYGVRWGVKSLRVGDGGSDGSLGSNVVMGVQGI